MKALYVVFLFFLLCFSPQFIAAQKLACVGLQGSFSLGGHYPPINTQYGLTAFYPITQRWGFMPEVGLKTNLDEFYVDLYPLDKTWEKTKSIQLKFMGTFSLVHNHKVPIPNVFLSIGYSLERAVYQSYFLAYGAYHQFSEWKLFNTSNRHDIFFGIGVRQRIGQRIFVVLRPEVSPLFFDIDTPRGELRLNLLIGYVR